MRDDVQHPCAALLVLASSALAACSPGPLEVASLSPESLRLGLVAHWTFDENTGSTIADHSGNGHAGQLTGGTWTTGRFGNALHLESGDSVSVPDFPQASASWSVSLWMRPPTGDFGPALVTLISTEIAFVGGWEMNIQPIDATHPVAVYNFGFARGSSPNDATYDYYDCNCVEVDQWTHLVAVLDAQAREIVFYDQGKLNGRKPIANQLQPGSQTLFMGRWSGADRLYTGDLDDIAIYNRALVPAEVAALDQHPVADPP